MFGKYPRHVQRMGRGELKGSQVFGFKTPKPTRAATIGVASVDTARRNIVVKEKEGADAYFEAHGEGDEAPTTSDRTLSKLNTPRLSQETLDRLLSEEPVRYEKEMSSLMESYRGKFDRWLQLLMQDFNLVLFGLGSKKAIAEEFRRSVLEGENCVVVNGFFPSLTVKQILNSITSEVLEHEGSFGSIPEQVEFIGTELTARADAKDVFLVVHNIDGPNLRADKAQRVLAQLSAHSKVHLVCSIDHINAPLIWDQQKLSKFNFVWFDATTFLPYSEETRNENSFMVSIIRERILISFGVVLFCAFPN
jgi:origin recognition complex subunit 2